jgi:hypothetical protein
MSDYKIGDLIKDANVFYYNYYEIVINENNSIYPEYQKQTNDFILLSKYEYIFYTDFFRE